MSTSVDTAVRPTRLPSFQFQSVEMTQMLEALTRAGDVVLDTFAGVAKWAERALAMGRHVILCDVDQQWVERIVGRFSNSFAAPSGQ